MCGIWYTNSKYASSFKRWPGYIDFKYSSSNLNSNRASPLSPYKTSLILCQMIRPLADWQSISRFCRRSSFKSDFWVDVFCSLNSSKLTSLSFSVYLAKVLALWRLNLTFLGFVQNTSIRSGPGKLFQAIPQLGGREVFINAWIGSTSEKQLVVMQVQVSIEIKSLGVVYIINHEVLGGL